MQAKVPDTQVDTQIYTHTYMLKHVIPRVDFFREQQLKCCTNIQVLLTLLQHFQGYLILLTVSGQTSLDCIFKATRLNFRLKRIKKRDQSGPKRYLRLNYLNTCTTYLPSNVPLL